MTEKKNLFQRIAGVMADASYIEKSSQNRHQGYAYTGHEQLTAILHPLYVKHGIVRSAQILHGELNAGQCFVAECEITWVNVDDPADRHSVRITSLAPSTSKTPQPAATQSGVALSYAVKTAEFKLFALTGDDTPDAASETQSRGEQMHAEASRVPDVVGLARSFDSAKTEADLQAARNAVKAVGSKLSKGDLETLGKARDAAIQRISWRDGAPQGGRS